MKRVFAVCLALLTISVIAACVTTPVGATSNPVGDKVGQSSASYLLGVPLGGDAGILAAAKKAGITKISTIDSHFQWWFVGWTVTTIVTGE